jgi:hypothetical protein
MIWWAIPLLAGKKAQPCSLAKASIFVLDVVVDSDDRLRRVGDLRCADGFELRDHGTGVVVRHDVGRLHGEEIPRADGVALGEIHGKALHDFLDSVLSHRHSQ